MRQVFVFPALLLAALGPIACQPREQAPVPPVITMPIAKPVQIPCVPDASGDWTQHAYHVRILHPIDHAPSAKVELALAWTPSALLVQARTDDTTPVESIGDLWDGDAVGIGVGSSQNPDDQFTLVFSPGRTAKQPKPRWHMYDDRVVSPALAAPEIHVDSDVKGYTMTLSLPWANLNRVPQPGEVINLQVWVNDGQGPNTLAHRTWYPSLDGGADHSVPVQLADKADAPQIATVSVQPRGFSDSAVEILAVPEAAGKKVEVWSGGKQVASGALAPGGFEGDSAADLPLPRERAAPKGASLIVTVGGDLIPMMLKVPDLAARRLDLVRDQPLAARPAIFDGDVFPSIDFLNKDLLEAVIGPYSLHPRFFDSNWNEVTAPTHPGRYGALIEFRSDDGPTCTRQMTLFKTAQPYFPAKDPYHVAVQFPAAFGLPAAAMAKEEWNISDWAGGTLHRLARTDTDGAVLVAALDDLARYPARFHGFAVGSIDDAWWAGLHQRLGESQEYPRLLHLPDGYDADPKKSWPLILFLHGSGERGTDLSKVRNEGPLHYIKQGHPLPFIVVTPQCPPGEWWTAARLAPLIDEVSAANRVDPKRIYVTGLSMGGFGTWDLAATYPDRFAAIAPISGGENPAMAERLRKMPTWVFHGSEDSIVPTRYSVDLVQAMQKLGAPVKLTIYQGVGHGGWDTTYDTPELYTWFLQHSR